MASAVTAAITITAVVSQLVSEVLIPTALAHHLVMVVTDMVLVDGITATAVRVTDTRGSTHAMRTLTLLRQPPL
jgi:hypothetical protein